METIAIIGLIVFIFVIIYKMSSGGSNSRQYSDEELKAMTIEEWREVAKSGITSQKTANLKALYRSFKEYNSRIDAGHPQTIDNLNDQGRERAREHLRLIEEELRSRGVKL